MATVRFLAGPTPSGPPVAEAEGWLTPPITGLVAAGALFPALGSRIPPCRLPPPIPLGRAPSDARLVAGESTDKARTAEKKKFGVANHHAVFHTNPRGGGERTNNNNKTIG